jgi:hypothetical protein
LPSTKAHHRLWSPEAVQHSKFILFAQSSAEAEHCCRYCSLGVAALATGAVCFGEAAGLGGELGHLNAMPLITSKKSLLWRQGQFG